MTAPEPARRPVARSRGGDPAPGLDVDRGRADEPHPLTTMQEAFGNLGAIRRLADPAVQARLEVGAPDDDYEREADRVAASIMRRPEPASGSADPHVQRRAEDDDKKKATPPPQRAPGAAQKAAPAPPPPTKATPPSAAAVAAPPKPVVAPPTQPAAAPKQAARPSPPPTPTVAPPKPTATPKKPPEAPKAQAEPAKKQPERRREDERVARKPAGAGVPAVTPTAARTIQSQQGAGRPLPPSERSFFESRFGRDLTGVRVHDDAAARNAARDVSAQAFTYGQDVYFGAGRYRPGTESGRELLAHELAHTIQQRPGARLERRVQRVPTQPPGPAGTTTTSGAAPTSTVGTAPAAPGSATSSKEAYHGMTVSSNAAAIDLANPPTQLKGSVTGTGAAKRLNLDEVNIPAFKLHDAPGNQWDKNARPFVKPAGFVRTDIQDTTWRNKVGLRNGAVREEFKTELERIINAQHQGPHVPVNENTMYRLVLQADTTKDFTGNVAALSRALSVPIWSEPAGQLAAKPYQVDHIRELQLANYTNPGNDVFADEPENLWLLDGAVNLKSGRDIQGAISMRITSFREGIEEYYKLREQAAGNRRNPVAAARGHMHTDLSAAGHPGLLSTDDTNAQYTVEFDRVGSGLGPKTVTPQQFWKRDKIENAHHLRWLRAHSTVARPGHITIFANAASATPAAAPGATAAPAAVELTVAGVEFDTHGTEPRSGERLRFLPPLAVDEKHLTAEPAGGTYGHLVMGFPRNKPLEFPAGADRRLDVHQVTGVENAAVIDPTQAKALLSGASYKRMSPVRILSAGVEPGRGFSIHGQIVADVPLLREGIDFEIAGDEISVYKEFHTGSFDVAAPLRVADSSLVVSAGTTTGLTVAGFIDFGIDRVGAGRISAAAGSHGFALNGDFQFESDIFDPARIAMRYEHIEHGAHNGLSIEGDIGIKRGRLRGIESATLHVAYADGHLEAHGHAVFEIPGVREADIQLTYDGEHGLMITASVVLGEIPGIRDGSLSVTVAERREGGWRVAAHGEATAAIPGLETRLVIDYDDGAFLAQATLPIHQGRLTGEITLGATNRPTDENNRPLPDAPPLPDVHIFGSGTAALDFGFVHGSATVRLLANGELEVEGTLSVPHVELWPPIGPPKEALFHPHPLEFPIFGPVVITIGGRVDREYGITAGVLSGSLSAHYNPAHEDQTHLHGAIHLHSSAFAGLDLVLTVGVGLDAIIGSLEADIALGAEIRVDANVDPDIQIDWTPTSGLSIDPVFEASLTPKLRFHIDAEITASLAFWSKTWTKNLAEKEFGSSLVLSVKLPTHYDEAHGFSVDWSHLEFHYPDIDPFEIGKEFLESLV
jgi:hypothetical protein